jgi:hypothetical protein
LPRWLQSDTDPWSCLVQGSPGNPPTWRCMIQTNFLHKLGTILSDHTCIWVWLSGFFSSLSLSHTHTHTHKTCMFRTVSDTHKQTESIAYLSSQRCDRLGEAQLCPWDRRVGVKASVDPSAHVHPPAPQVPYSPLFPVQADTARTAPSSNLSPQRTRIFLLLFFLLTPTREMQSKCNDKTAQQHHTRESTTFDPQHQTQVLHSTKRKPPWKRFQSVALQIQTLLLMQPLPQLQCVASRRVAHPVCPSPALASSRAGGRTDGLETRPRGLVRGLLYDCVVKLRQRGHSTWLACWVVMTAYLRNSRFSSRPFCWRGKDTLVSLLVTTTPY